VSSLVPYSSLRPTTYGLGPANCTNCTNSVLLNLPPALRGESIGQQSKDMDRDSESRVLRDSEVCVSQRTLKKSSSSLFSRYADGGSFYNPSVDLNTMKSIIDEGHDGHVRDEGEAMAELDSIADAGRMDHSRQRPHREDHRREDHRTSAPPGGEATTSSRLHRHIARDTPPRQPRKIDSDSSSQRISDSVRRDHSAEASHGGRCVGSGSGQVSVSEADVESQRLTRARMRDRHRRRLSQQSIGDVSSGDSDSSSSGDGIDNNREAKASDGDGQAPPRDDAKQTVAEEKEWPAPRRARDVPAELGNNRVSLEEVLHGKGGRADTKDDPSRSRSLVDDEEVDVKVRDSRGAS